MNVPTAVALTLRLSVADVPAPLILALVTVSAGGTRAGRKENADPVKLTPAAASVGIVAPRTRNLGVMEVICASGRTVNAVLEVVVVVPTVTDMVR